MTRVAILGAGGRLGRRLVALASEHGIEVVAALAHPGSASLGTDVGVLAGIGPVGVQVVPASVAALGGAEVILDVSAPGALRSIAGGLAGRAVVSGVTGGTADDEALWASLAGAGPVLHATNFSLGVAVLVDLAARASRALPDFDLEIVETHHRHKRDAPSGTAWTLAEAVAGARGQVAREVVRSGRSGVGEPRQDGEIGMHALRCGDVVGEHTVWLSGSGERVQLGHVATSRDTFAHGALRAAAWIHGRPPGRYDLRSVLGLEGAMQAPRQSPDAR